MAEELYARVGAEIRARREAAGLTQAALASRTGLSRSSVTNIERGGQAILLHQLVDLARALRADPLGMVATAFSAAPAGAGGDQASDARMAELIERLGPPARARR